MIEFRTPFEGGVYAHASTLGEFTYRELCDVAGVSYDQLRDYVKRWIAAGAVVKADAGEIRGKAKGAKGNQAVFRVLDRISAAEAAEGPQEKMWRSARYLKSFTPSQIQMHSSTGRVEVTLEDARDFCRMLLRGRLVSVRQKANPGGREARYILCGATGPLPPQEVRISAIWDPNERRFLHLPEVG